MPVPVLNFVNEFVAGKSLLLINIFYSICILPTATGAYIIFLRLLIFDFNRHPERYAFVLDEAKTFEGRYCTVQCHW